MKKIFFFLAATIISCTLAAQTISSSTVSLRYCFDDEETINEEFCPNVGITINGQFYNTAGTHTQHLSTVRGCDSTLTIVLTESSNCVPEGAIDALFSVSSTKKVYFSKGNLQYIACASTPGDLTYTAADGTTKRGKWQFAEHQYTVLGSVNNNPSASKTTPIDVFGWGTSNFDEKYPYLSTANSADYLSGEVDLTGINAYYDWGVYNPISNGGDTPGLWRTLTMDEWEYLFARNGKAGGAKVNGVQGIVLLPDNWQGEAIQTSMLAKSTGAANTYTLQEWEAMENNGAVFLPFTNYRNGTTMYNIQANSQLTARYWHSSGIHDHNISDYAQKARYLWHDGGATSSPTKIDGYYGLHVSWDLYRFYGFAVRLVSDAN